MRAFITRRIVMNIPQVLARKTEIGIPQLALIAATRGMVGLGIGLLVAEHIPKVQRSAIGWTLFITGALSTIPLAAAVIAGLRGR
jgi:hypothetical protein